MLFPLARDRRQKSADKKNSKIWPTHNWSHQLGNKFTKDNQIIYKLEIYQISLNMKLTINDDLKT